MADIAYFQRVTESYRAFHLLVRHSHLFRAALLLITFVINILILATWYAPEDASSHTPVVNSAGYVGVFHNWFQTRWKSSVF